MLVETQFVPRASLLMTAGLSHLILDLKYQVCWSALLSPSSVTPCEVPDFASLLRAIEVGCAQAVRTLGQICHRRRKIQSTTLAGGALNHCSCSYTLIFFLTIADSALDLARGAYFLQPYLFRYFGPVIRDSWPNMFMSIHLNVYSFLAQRPCHGALAFIEVYHCSLPSEAGTPRSIRSTSLEAAGALILALSFACL
ncbi:unnamed protein product [Protopolystoma xenopodis]|uniref:Uncharacterized protein n=1 Tax=Protopolystoma xenopodis TaxID=117903 RepID=A0A3S5B2Z0_9PLAT|nr:unnamed protein product [Protopolystoma xenopodis]